MTTFLIGLFVIVLFGALLCLYEEFDDFFNGAFAIIGLVTLVAIGVTAAGYVVIGVPYAIGTFVRWLFGF